LEKQRIGDTLGTPADMMDLIVKSIEDERSDYRRVLEEIYRNEEIPLDPRHAEAIYEVLERYGTGTADLEVEE
jgi:hypothetical protein